MSYKIHTNDNTILHSDIYMGTDFSEGFEHWKYIKRYKGKNGKWKYVYADKKTHKQIAANKKAAKLHAESVKKYKKSEDFWKRVLSGYKRDGIYLDTKGFKNTTKNISIDKMNKMNNLKSMEKYNKTANKLINDNSISTKISKGRSKIKKILKIK